MPETDPPTAVTEPTDAAGDPRWPKPTADDLLGQRARQRPAREMARPDGHTTAAVATTLPDLEPGCYLLEPTDARDRRARRRQALRPLHGLALDTALGAGGDAVWVDAQGHATTQALCAVAPSERALERVHVARAFTCQQHRTLVETVRRWLTDDAASPFGTPATDRPAVLVCPAVDALYRASDRPERRAKRSVTRTLAVLQGLARDQELPVLVTRAGTDDLAAPVQRATTTIELTQTQFGPRLTCDSLAFETLVYPDDGPGDGVQTTLAFWREVLARRHPDVATATSDDRAVAATGPQSPDAGPSR